MKNLKKNIIYNGDNMKKKLIIFSIIIVISLITLFLNYINENKIYENNYNEIVKVIKKKKIFDEKNNIIGEIEPNTYLYLENKINKKYKIKGEDFYIDYHNVKKEEVNNDINLIPFNEIIITKDSFNLYKENTKLIHINKSVRLNIYKKENDNYIVNYLNQYFTIKKEDIKEILIEGENINTEYIPVLYFCKIEENNKYNESLKKDKYDEIINYLNEKQVNYINIEEYNNWIKGSIVLPQNSILLISENPDISNNIYYKEDININNTVSTINNKNAYKINNNVNISEIKFMLEGKDIIEKNIDDSKYASSIPVLNYHFFYENGENCHETICLNKIKFEQQLKYLNEQGYKTLTMREYIDWYDGKIELPKKSVLLTIDDGAFGTDTHLPQLLNKYQIHATLFLITAWWPKEKYISPYLDIESHGDDIHILGNCGKEKLLCLNKKEIIQDLKKSIEKLNSAQAFCYPFYKYNSTSIEAIKELGFEVAFAGGYYNSTRNSNRYIIPRYPIYNEITMEQFINMIKV